MCKESNVKFTPEEEKLIQKSVQESQDKERQMMIDAEIRNRVLSAQSQQPGYRYY